MQNIQVGSQEKVYIEAYSNGVLSQADSVTTINIYDADNDATPLLTGTAFDEPEVGSYSFMLTPPLTDITRVLEIVWTYQINGVAFIQKDYYSVDEVYASVSDIIDFLGYGKKPSDINYHKTEEIISAEKIARTIVEGYTYQVFSTRYGSQEMIGNGSDALSLIEKQLTIDQMWEDDLLVIDNTQNPPVNTFGFPLEITQTGFAVRIVDPGWDIRYDNQVDPTILYYGRFRDNSRYKLVGNIGYKYVPDDIKLATMLLVNDVLSNDFNWRNKYLNKVDLSEISFEMHGGAFNGTGNITVDNILDQYRNVNIVII